MALEEEDEEKRKFPKTVSVGKAENENCEVEIRNSKTWLVLGGSARKKPFSMIHEIFTYFELPFQFWDCGARRKKRYRRTKYRKGKKRKNV